LNQRAKILGWLLIVAAPPAFLLAVEGGVRLFGIRPGFERDAELPPWMDRNILVKDARWVELLSTSPRDLRNYYSTYEWDRYLFYRLKPDVAIPLTDVLAPPGIRERTRWVLRTNAKGFGGPEVPYGPHPGTYRVLCMGDSSTFGWGVESEEAYPSLLGEELRRRHPGVRVEVVNLGVCGYSSQQGKVLLEREGVRYEPDLVTISYGSNDWSRVPEPYDEVYRRNLRWTGALREFLHGSRAYQIYSAFLMRTLRGGGGVDVNALKDAALDMPFNVGPDRSTTNLIAMVDRVREMGADPILVANCTPGEMDEPIRRASDRSGAPLLDTETVLHAALPALDADAEIAPARARVQALYGDRMIASHPDLEVYLADRCHPNAVGQRLLARTLAGMIERSPSFLKASGG
jgi:lysophospholipase L1-like esterase